MPRRVRCSLQPICSTTIRLRPTLEIRGWLDGSLDRITGYQHVVNAISAAAAALQGKTPPPDAALDSPIIGASIKTKEAPAMLRGETRYVADITLPGMAHAEILRSTLPHARLRRIDTSAARSMPGVAGRLYRRGHR